MKTAEEIKQRIEEELAILKDELVEDRAENTEPVIIAMGEAQVGILEKILVEL